MPEESFLYPWDTFYPVRDTNLYGRNTFFSARDTSCYLGVTSWSPSVAFFHARNTSLHIRRTKSSEKGSNPHEKARAFQADGLD